MRERESLLKLEGGQVQVRMTEARGHCTKILNIYSQHLWPWFDRVLPSAEAGELRDLFISLDEFDGVMITAIDELAAWLTVESSATLTLVDDGQLDEANARVREARKDVLPARLAVSKAMRELLELQAEFVGVSGTV